MQQEAFAGLKKIPFLSQLSDEVLITLAERAKSAKYPKQTMIVSEGDESSSLYIIISGKVRVFSSDDKSKEVTLLIQEQGSYFGEIALLSDQLRSASVVTLEKTVCAVISKSDFIHWLLNYPDVAVILLGVLSEKIKQLTGKLREMALSNVYERTIKALHELAIIEGDISVIHNRPTQQELASMVGASREMINKVMHELTKGGYIVIEDKTLIIHKKLPSSW
ncbi:Crp/Fnr family transcriptional regulator [Methyloglobulus sp.]|jgi:CRP/FNR family transcriptional regulator, cyclic AMP receptor protein|uniref:Crp/Fnr family transcriptional regulator n=1 Tax=Methyloglobulus sp. TaxID=2518622 RepID=UPI0032B82647